MTCTTCGEQPKKACNDFTKAVVEINNPEKLILFRRVDIPTSMGDETTVPPAIGKYRNALVYYEASGNAYLYSSDGIPTRLTPSTSQGGEAVWGSISGNISDQTDLQQEFSSLEQSILGQVADSKGEIYDLTTADYNYTFGSGQEPDCIALWELEPGKIYKNSSSEIKFIWTTSVGMHFLTNWVGVFIVTPVQNGLCTVIHIASDKSTVVSATEPPILYLTYDVSTGALTDDGIVSDIKYVRSKMPKTVAIVKQSSEWSTLSDSSPYTYSTEVQLPEIFDFSQGTNWSEVSLVNNNLVAFAEYQFGILDWYVDYGIAHVTIASVGLPPDGTVLKIKVTPVLDGDDE